MLDHAKIKKLLDHFKDLPRSALDFNRANFYLKDESGNGACVFARVACVLGGEDWKLQDTLPDGTTLTYWYYLDGVPLLCEAFDMYQDALQVALYNNGAPADAHLLEWDTHPHEVLLKTYQQRCQNLGEAPVAIDAEREAATAWRADQDAKNHQARGADCARRNAD